MKCEIEKQVTRKSQVGHKLTPKRGLRQASAQLFFLILWDLPELVQNAQLHQAKAPSNALPLKLVGKNCRFLNVHSSPSPSFSFYKIPTKLAEELPLDEIIDGAMLLSAYE